MVRQEWVVTPTLFCEKKTKTAALGAEEKSMSKLTDKIAELARPVVEQEGCSLWDVEYLKEAGTRYLRVYIDKPEGVNIDDCERISRRLDAMLDEADPIPESYVVEVGSAGIERELKRPSDFEAFLGSEVELRLYQPVNGQKSFVGTLCGRDEDGTIEIEIKGKRCRFNKQQTAQVRLHATI